MVHGLHLELNPIEAGGRSLLEGARTTSGANPIETGVRSLLAGARTTSEA